MMRCLILGCMIALVGSTTALAAKETLKIGFEKDDYAPFEFQDQDGKTVGFDIDIINALCAELSQPCQLQGHPFNEIIDKVSEGTLDIGISALDITEERQEKVIFTEPYFQTSAQYIGWKNHIKTIKDLKGKTVGVQGSTSLQRYLHSLRTMKIIAYDNNPEAIFGLSSGKVEAIFSDEAMIQVYLQRDIDNARLLNREPNMNIIGNPVNDERYFGELGIAVSPDNTQLRDQMNSALKKIKEDGSYQKIYDKWFNLVKN